MRGIALLLAVMTLAACGHLGYAKYSSIGLPSHRGTQRATKRRPRM
jgi:hypothetical protein